MILEIHKYIPEASQELIFKLHQKHPFELKIKNQRKTKHGDFRVRSSQTFLITVNNDLNPYKFLITLVHEIAHLVAYSNHKRTKPHGTAWKQTFKYLMLPFLTDAIFPSDILSPLAHYLKNPKARTDSDIKLSLALRNYDEKTDKKLIFELDLDAEFSYNDRVFKKGIKRKTRIECVEVNTKKRYLFHQNAEVLTMDLIKNNNDK